MGRLAAAAALAFVAAACGASSAEPSATAGAAPATAPRPVLTVLSADPLRLAGSGFRPGEAVRVTVEVDERTVAVSRRAGARGRFWVTLPEAACTVSARAVGGRGSRASASFAHVTCPQTS